MNITRVTEPGSSCRCANKNAIGRDTPPKFHIIPENKSLEKESPFGNHYFQVNHVKFRGVYSYQTWAMGPNMSILSRKKSGSDTTQPCLRFGLFVGIGNQWNLGEFLRFGGLHYHRKPLHNDRTLTGRILIVT